MCRRRSGERVKSSHMKSSHTSSRAVLRVLGACVVAVLLLALWPNLVHEPLHAVALRMQGNVGVIAYDWSIPAHPSITPVRPLASVAGALWYLLLPSLASVAIIVGMRARAATWYGVPLLLYLACDLALNVLTFSAPTSDFRVLQVYGGAAAAYSAAAIILAMTGVLIANAMVDAKTKKTETGVLCEA
jgi:hypothetical protein